ncbi:MAG: PhoH family protein, partial [Ignisphaera sp.]
MSILGNIKPLTSGQEEMYNALKDKSYEILGFFGPTGTGKSLFSLAYGIDSVMEGIHSRFIIIRSIVDIVTGQEVDITTAPEVFIESMKSYLRDIIGGYIEWSKIETLIIEGKIVLAS